MEKLLTKQVQLKSFSQIPSPNYEIHQELQQPNQNQKTSSFSYPQNKNVIINDKKEFIKNSNNGGNLKKYLKNNKNGYYYPEEVEVYKNNGYDDFLENSGDNYDDEEEDGGVLNAIGYIDSDNFSDSGFERAEVEEFSISDIQKMPRLPGDGASNDNENEIFTNEKSPKPHKLNLELHLPDNLQINNFIETSKNKNRIENIMQNSIQKSSQQQQQHQQQLESKPQAVIPPSTLNVQRIHSVRILDRKPTKDYLINNGTTPSPNDKRSSIYDDGSLYSEEGRCNNFMTGIGFGGGGEDGHGNDDDPNNSKKGLNNEMYSAFKRANVIKGILCPSLTNSFKNRSLERSYLTYTHRQRQKSLIIVNMVDFILKAVLAMIWYIHSKDDTEKLENSIAWSACCMIANLAICILGLWKCFANNYLHWAATFTWLLFNIQGFVGEGLGFTAREYYLVWYILFIIFVPYAMLPLPLKWCVIAGTMSASCHLIVIAIVKLKEEESDEEGTDCVLYQIFTNFLLYTAINIAGMYTKYLTDRGQRLAFIETHKAMEHKRESENEFLKTQKLLDSS